MKRLPPLALPLLVCLCACGAAPGAPAGALADVAAADPATGQVGVQVTVAARPYVDALRLPGLASVAAAGAEYTVWRTALAGRPSDDPSLPSPVAAGAALQLRARIANLPGGDGAAPGLSAWLEDDCGGLATPVAWGADGEARFTWLAPPDAGLCRLTAAVALDGAADRFPLALLVAE